MNNCVESLTIFKLRTRRLFFIKTLLFFVFFCFAFEGNTASAQSNKIVAVPNEEIVAKVDEYMNALVGLHRFNGSVLVARDGKILVSRSYGTANLEDNVPNTPQTKFHLASITKQFTAAAILLLQERGKLNVQDSICKYLSDCPAAWQQITIHQLLTHSSGIPNFTDFPDWLQTRALPTTFANAVSRFKDKPLDFQPGEKYNYSNSGYVLLGYIIEKVSGRTYEGFLRDSIFLPLKMLNTGYDDNKILIEHRAIGYSREGIRLARAPYLNISTVKAAGGLYSTAQDLYLWSQALDTEKLLAKKSLDAMFTVHKGDYGYGWHIDMQLNRRRANHGGVQIGFKTNIDRYLDDKVSIVLLCNFDGAFINGSSRDLAAIVFGEKYNLPKERPAITLDAKVYDAYVGQYELGADFILTVTKEGNRIIGEADGRKFELFPETDAKFFVREYDAQIMFVFSKDEKGQVTHLTYNRNQQAPKVK